MEWELGISHEMEEVLSTDWVPVVFITVSVSTLIQRAPSSREFFLLWLFSKHLALQTAFIWRYRQVFVH